jgi:hypothetical protein
MTRHPGDSPYDAGTPSQELSVQILSVHPFARDPAHGSEFASFMVVEGVDMGSRQWICGLCLSALLLARAGEAQWRDPKLIAGQVGFHIAISFVGKMVVHHESPGHAIRQAVKEGAVSGLIAHGGYTLVGQNPDLALVGKALAQKSSLTTRRSIHGEPVFDRSLYTHWELTHSFVHAKWEGELRPRVELDAINAAFSAYFLLSPERYELQGKRTLTSGSLVFVNKDPRPGLRGYYIPGVIWIDDARNDSDWVLSHEIVHSLQAERGSAIKEWHHANIRFNWLVFASGVPAMLAGWPDHDTRWHEIEADDYAGERPPRPAESVTETP